MKTIGEFLVKILCLFLLVVIFVGVFLIVIFIDDTTFAEKELATYYSEDGTYQLVIYEIGEPEWPFGPATGRLVLSTENSQISKTDVDVANDGGHTHSEDFDVSWSEDHVTVVVHGQEMYDKTYTLYFDGKTEFTQETPTPTPVRI